MMKRMSSRRQKRWWNAYILFYTRTDTDPAITALPATVTSGDGTQLAAQLKQLSLSQYPTPSDADQCRSVLLAGP